MNLCPPRSSEDRNRRLELVSKPVTLALYAEFNDILAEDVQPKSPGRRGRSNSISRLPYLYAMSSAISPETLASGEISAADMRHATLMAIKNNFADIAEVLLTHNPEFDIDATYSELDGLTPLFVFFLVSLLRFVVVVVVVAFFFLS
jgi:hypothetical protein